MAQITIRGQVVHALDESPIPNIVVRFYLASGKVRPRELDKRKVVSEAKTGSKGQFRVVLDEESLRKQLRPNQRRVAVVCGVSRNSDEATIFASGTKFLPDWSKELQVIRVSKEAWESKPRPREETDEDSHSIPDRDPRPSPEPTPDREPDETKPDRPFQKSKRRMSGLRRLLS